MRNVRHAGWPVLAAFLGSLSWLVGTGMARAEEPAATAAPQQFLYVLRLVPRLHDDAAWTEADRNAVSQHFRRLQQATAEGRVILAGRTTEPGAQTFGLVIFEATDEAAARQFMESDPSVAAGVMTATLHPYTVALLRDPANVRGPADEGRHPSAP